MPIVLTDHPRLTRRVTLRSAIFFILPGQPYDYGGVKRQPRNITFGARSLVSKCLPVMYHLNQRTFESCPMPNVCLAGNELGHISAGTPRYSTPFGGDYVPISQSGKWPKPELWIWVAYPTLLRTWKPRPLLITREVVFARPFWASMFVWAWVGGST